MEVLEAIHSRRSVYDFLPQPVPPEDLSLILEAGIWAPNHKLTQPWRFRVLGRQTLEALAEFLAADQIAALPEVAGDDTRAKARDSARAKIVSKPTVVAVSVVSVEGEMRRREDTAATCAAVENILLAAWS